MNRINIIKNLAAALVVGMSFTACDKVKEVDPIGDRGQTIVKLVGGGNPGDKAFAIDFAPTPITLTAADLRRDVASNADLNKTMNVTIKDDTAALRAYDPTLVYFPANFYTIGSGTPKTGGKGGVFNITMNPGEFAKPITITVPNATLLDPSTKYGLAFTIVSVDAGGIMGDAKTIVVQIGAKNDYDGIYSVVSGNVQRYTAGVPEPLGGLNGPLAGNQDVALSTVGATTVQIPNPGPGGIQWAFGSSSGVAGVDGIQITVNPATNLTTAISLGNASFSNWAGKPNYYDPATKTFYLSWRWNPTGNTREYEIVLKYKGPR